MKALDLFCGLGGWSDGLALEGFDVLGVEIEPKICELYKHPVICQDVQTLDPSKFKGYDLIVGSPPCRDFTVGSDSWWKIKKNPERGINLVNAFLNFVDKAKPTFWLMENVRGLIKHLDLSPRGIFKLSRSMYRPFWGNYPAFLIPVDYTKPLMKEVSNYPKSKPRSRIKAKIPVCVSRSLGQAIKGFLQSK